MKKCYKKFKNSNLSILLLQDHHSDYLQYIFLKQITSFKITTEFRHHTLSLIRFCCLKLCFLNWKLSFFYLFYSLIVLYVVMFLLAASLNVPFFQLLPL